MIVGIGTDIVSVARIEAALGRHGEAFPRRILTPHELADYGAAPHPARFLAKRFAAKEALAKATGQGLRHPVGLRSAGIIHDALGKPQFDYSPVLAEWLRQRGIGSAHVSISDEQDYVIAFVILEGGH